MKLTLKPLLLGALLTTVALVSVSSKAASKQDASLESLQESILASITQINLSPNKIAIVTMTKSNALSMRPVANVTDFTPHKPSNKNRFFEMAHKFNDSLQMILSSFTQTSAIEMHNNDMKEDDKNDDNINVSSKSIPSNCNASKKSFS